MPLGIPKTINPHIDEMKRIAHKKNSKSLLAIADLEYPNANDKIKSKT